MITINALGTIWLIELFDPNHEQDLHDQINSIIADFDDNYSRFKPQSLLTKLARGEKIAKNPELVRMFDFAHSVYTETNGIFDIGVGEKLFELGYGQTDIESNPANWLDLLKSDDESYWLESPKALDFGGFGKGWLVDKIAEFLKSKSITQFYINAGGDIYCQSDKQIKFYLEHPWADDQAIGEVLIQNGAFCGSSINKRAWEVSDRSVNHIVGSNDRIASFILSDTTTMADTYATLALILSPKNFAERAKKHNLEWIVIDKDGAFTSNSKRFKLYK